jgi:ATP-dependent DNA ligase
MSECAEGWIALTNGVVGAGRALYRAVVDADREGIVAKRLADPYNPQLASWHKVLNRDYSQRLGGAEWFRERRGRQPRRAVTAGRDLGSPTI